MEENGDALAIRRGRRLSKEYENVSSPATPTKKKAGRVAAKPLLDNIKEDKVADTKKGLPTEIKSEDKWKDRSKIYRKKLKEDKERYLKYLEKERDRNRKRYQAMKAKKNDTLVGTQKYRKNLKENKEKYLEHLAKERERDRRRYQAKKAAMSSPVNIPKPSRRLSTARDQDDEKPVTPSRRSTRIRSNTSLVLENVMQSVQADSPRAKRAARRNSLAGSDSEAPSTPVKTTRRTRKDSTSSIENKEPVASKPIIEETIAEEPESHIESLSPNNASNVTQPSRRSPRLAKRSKKSGEFANDDDKNVVPKQSSELNSSSEKGKKKPANQSKTPETKKLDGDKIPDIMITDSTKDATRTQRAKSWTTISNDRVEPEKIDQSLIITDRINGNGDFLGKDANEVASIELLQDVAPKNIQCDVYIEDSSSNGDMNKIDDTNKEFDTQSTKLGSTECSLGLFEINVETVNLSCVPMDIDETVLEMTVDADGTLRQDVKETSLNTSEVKATNCSQTIFDTYSNNETLDLLDNKDIANKSLNKSKNKKSSLSKTTNESLDQLAYAGNPEIKETHNDNTNQSIKRKSSLAKSINESIDQLASEENLLSKESDKTNNSLNKSKTRKSSQSTAELDSQSISDINTNQSLNKSKNRKSSLSKSINDTLDQFASEDNLVIKQSQNDTTHQYLNKSKNRKSSLSKSINESLNQLASEDNLLIKESRNDTTDQSLNKSKNRKSSLSKSVNEIHGELASDDNLVVKESQNNTRNQSLNKSKNRKSSLSKSINESHVELASDDNLVIQESQNDTTNKSLNKSKNRKSSLSKSINESLNHLASEDSHRIKESQTDITNQSLNKSKNRKSSLSNSINGTLDKLASEDNLGINESQKDTTNKSLNKSKNRKSSLSKSINESHDELASDDNFAIKESQYKNNSLNKSKNRKSSLSKSKESLDQLDFEDDFGLKKSQNESTLNVSKSKKNSSLSVVQELKQKTNETNSFKVNDDTNFGEYTENKTFNNAKSNISFDETDSNVSISKKTKKKISSNSKTFDKTENENKSTLILSRVDDSSNDHSMNKSQKASLNTSTVLEHHKKRNLSDIQDNTPLRNKNVKGLGLQTSTPVVADQKGSKSKKPEVSEIAESSSSDSESEESEGSDDDTSEDDDSTSERIKKSMFFDDEAEDAEEDYQSGDSNSKENDSEEDEDDSEDEDNSEVEESTDNEKDISLKQVQRGSKSKKPEVSQIEESDKSSSDTDTEDEEHSENEKDISLNKVNVDENASMSRLDATSDPLLNNDDDNASLCSENEEILKGYDSVLEKLNKSGNKNIKQNNLSLNVDKKMESKENILIDQLNLTQTKNRKTVNKNKDKVSEDNKMQVIKAPSGNRDSDSSSLDIQLRFSDSNSGDGVNDKDSQDYIPLKRSFAATNLHNEPEISNVLNNSTKKIVTPDGEAKKNDISAGRDSQEKENHNVTNFTKKNKKLSESTLLTPSKVTNIEKMENQVQSSSVSQVTTVVEKIKKRKRVSDPQEEIENIKEQPNSKKVKTKKPKRNTSIIEEPEPRRRKRKAVDDNELGNNNKKPKILTVNRFDNIHIPRLAPAVLHQLEGASETKSASPKKTKAVATSSFVIEETVKRQIKPSHYLEQSVHLDTDSPEKLIPKKRAPLPKVLPFVPTAVTSSQGFTTRFQISVLPKETKFTAQTSNTKNFKNDYLFGKNIKRMETYALYKKNRNNKLSKF